MFAFGLSLPWASFRPMASLLNLSVCLCVCAISERNHVNEQCNELCLYYYFALHQCTGPFAGSVLHNSWLVCLVCCISRCCVVGARVTVAVTASTRQIVCHSQLFVLSEHVYWRLRNRKWSADRSRCWVAHTQFGALARSYWHCTHSDHLE